ncbi:MAG: DNA helicase RecQ [Clostridiales bacterium]|jgi:ATP-dependent DNA helicase RecQ|nr:DNA helicase RecQ [Clostridiales bacterium]
MTAKKLLKQYFGYDEFREGQLELIDAMISGGDVLGIMATGAGKSLCYQIPAMILPGVTLVISPLISLMRDQVQALAASGIPAAFLNSSLTEKQWNKAVQNAKNGMYKIIYVAPERLFTSSMTELVCGLDVSLIAVDEAHCISQWGQDFRPSYLDIPKFAAGLPVRPVLAAFTATATPRVREDILRTLELKNPLAMVTGFDRPNLYFEVRRLKDKYSSLVRYLRENSGAGIIYCSTRKETDSVTEMLLEDKFSAARYHAGLSESERSKSQDDFLYDRVKIIVATNAFGMGIDKSDIRFIVHYNMPQNIESYYQEAGRAGRDGLPSDCIMFYARKDINTALFLINQSENPDEIARNRKLLNKMEQFCETGDCLRRYILDYFGESTDDCGNCGNCNDTSEEIDITSDAQKILSHITRLNNANKRFMFTHTADILLGKSDDFTDLSTFGIMKGTPRSYIRKLISRLTALSYICDDGYLSVTPKAKEVLYNGAAVTMRGQKPEITTKKEKPPKVKYNFSDELFIKLKNLRLEIAREEKVPAFIVFSDATLVDMCQKHPRTEEEMLTVSGVGEVKLKRYGIRFIELLCEETPASAPGETKNFTKELFMQEITIENESIQITRVADNFNAVFLKYGKEKITGAKLNNLLLEAGYLIIENGVKLPTSRGREIGIITIRRNTERGNFSQCLFGAEAQRICAELLVITGD